MERLSTREDFEKAAFSYLDANRENLGECLASLISVQSVNQGYADSCDERDIAKAVEQEFNALGLQTEVIYGDEKGIRPNVVGTLKGAGEGRGLLFNAHMDTVPIADDEKWNTPPFVGTIVNDCVYGRGANDDKNGIAAMIYAVKAVQAAGVPLKGDVVLLASAGEESNEGGVYGAGKAIEKGHIRADFAIIAEESGMSLLTSSPSLCFFEVIIPGKSIHASARNQAVFPQEPYILSGNSVGVDALEKALPIIEMLYRKERDWNINTMRPKPESHSSSRERDNQGVGIYTINPCSIHGESYIGALIGELHITYSVWHDSSLTVDQIKEEIERDINAVASTDSWLREHPPILRMPILQTWKGFSTDSAHSGVEMLRDVYQRCLGRDAVTTEARFVCDATYISEQGIPCVVFGPGSVENGCHGANEFCSIDSLLETAKIYASAIIDWCS